MINACLLTTNYVSFNNYKFSDSNIETIFVYFSIIYSISLSSCNFLLEFEIDINRFSYNIKTMYLWELGAHDLVALKKLQKD